MILNWLKVRALKKRQDEINEVLKIYLEHINKLEKDAKMFRAFMSQINSEINRDYMRVVHQEIKRGVLKSD